MNKKIEFLIGMIESIGKDNRPFDIFKRQIEKDKLDIIEYIKKSLVV